MFGQNQVVGKKFFTDSPEARAGKLLVTSAFATLQGEGPLMGRPAAFVRLAMCQLSCSWCDSFFDKGDWMDVGQVLDHVELIYYEATGQAPSLLVVTGGEPTLQGPALLNLLRGAHSVGWQTQIETNGVLAPDAPSGTVVVVSPKCAEKDGRATQYMSPNPQTLDRATCLKFVISADSQSPYHKVPEWALAWRTETGREVFVSPMNEYRHAPGQARELYEGRAEPTLTQRSGAAEVASIWEPGLLDMARCRRNHEYAAQYAMRHDLRLSLQMHLFASLP